MPTSIAAYTYRFLAPPWLCSIMAARRRNPSWSYKSRLAAFRGLSTLLWQPWIPEDQFPSTVSWEVESYKWTYMLLHNQNCWAFHWANGGWTEQQGIEWKLSMTKYATIHTIHQLCHTDEISTYTRGGTPSVYRTYRDCGTLTHYLCSNFYFKACTQNCSLCSAP